MRRAGAMVAALLAVTTTALGGAAPAIACGADSPCRVQDAAGATLGEYLITDARDGAATAGGPAPAIIFLHGWRATAAAMMRNRGLREAAEAVGARLVLPQGAGQTWSYPGSPARFRDEFAFFAALRDDVIRRHNIDPTRILIAGFSMGASMAWNVGCAQGSGYLGVAAFAGAFWEPLPERCEDPAAAILHTHGTADGVVPIAGRPIGSNFAQGDARDSLALLTEQLTLSEESDFEDGRGYACQRWRGEIAGGGVSATGAPVPEADLSTLTGDPVEVREDGSLVYELAPAAPQPAGPRAALYEFCTHDGGHIYRGAWLERAYRLLTESPETE